MKRRTHTLGFAVLVELVIVGAVVWSAFALPGCGMPWADTIHTAEELAVAECKHWLAHHPEATFPASVCDTGSDLFADIIALIDAKDSPKAVVDSLIAHPPLSAAANAALVLPCIEAKPSAEEPQSRLEKLNRRLYPPVFIVDPGHEGE